MKISLLSLIIFIGINGMCQLDNKYFYYSLNHVKTRSDMLLAGNVKSVVQKSGNSITFSATGKITEYTLMENQALYCKYNYTYDALDRLIEKKIYYATDKTTTRYKLVYTDSLFTCQVNQFDQNDSLKGSATHTFTKSWLPTSDWDGTYKYGLNWILEKQCNIYGECQTYEYNSENKVIKISESKTNYKTYSYDDKGRMSLLQFYEGGKLKAKYVYHYNDLNILTKRAETTYIYPKSAPTVVTNHQISYSIKVDGTGNWISVTKSGDTIDKPDSRKITYY